MKEVINGVTSSVSSLNGSIQEALSKFNEKLLAEKCKKTEILKKVDVGSILTKVKADIRKLEY